MTMKGIRAMFAPGQRWHATREGGGKHRDEIRTVAKVRGKDIVFRLDDGSLYYTDFPTASEVKEARHGFLRFEYSTLLGAAVTLELLPSPLAL